ncbi:MAG: hypothetical protein ACKPH7_01695 [Planktothrix sp.]|uniref:hypothetical protein n=2 Tax=Planktothrix sp. TaxID=3088171 RepID=UPI0038D36560
MAILIEPPQNELSALQNLSDSAGFLKKTGDGSYSIDTNSYLPLSGGTVSGAIFAGSLNGNGSGLTSLNASNISTGTLNAARLPAFYLPLSGGTVTGVTSFSNATSSTSTTTGAVVVLGGVGVGGAVFARNLYTTGNTGIGNGTPTATLHVGGGNGNLHVPSNGGMLIKGDSGGRSLLEIHSPDGFSRTVLQCLNSGPTYLASLDERALLLQTSGGNVGINTASPSQKLDVNGSAKATSFFVGNNQVVSSRRTGWTAPTGTASRTTFVTSTVTLVQLAERIKALIDDLTAHGLIGA